MQICVPELLHGWRHIYRIQKILLSHAKSGRIVEKACPFEHCAHPYISVILHYTHDIGCYADLYAMKLRMLKNFVSYAANYVNMFKAKKTNSTKKLDDLW